MDLDLAGMVAVVTGASRGLGRAISVALADEGCALAIVARRSEPLRELADELEAAGHNRPTIIAEDVTDDRAAERISEQALAAHRRVDSLVNNAGGSRPLTGLGTRDEWDEAMNLDFHAGRELAHTLVPGMRTRKFGRIINVTGGDEPSAVNAGVPPNGAVHLWSKALSREVAHDGVTVNCLPPGRLHSDQVDQRLLPDAKSRAAWIRDNIPAGYIGEPADFAPLVAFLASPRARYITGQVIHIDGGARRYAH